MTDQQQITRNARMIITLLAQGRLASAWGNALEDLKAKHGWGTYRAARELAYWNTSEGETA